MNKCYLTNCNRGVGTISKKQDIKTIYHGDLQNGYDKGDLFDANAVIDQIKKHGGGSGGDSSNKKTLELQLNFQDFPTDYYQNLETANSIVRFTKYIHSNEIVNVGLFGSPEDLYNVDIVNISIINIPDDYSELKLLFSTNNKFTFYVSYKVLADDKLKVLLKCSDVVSDTTYIELNLDSGFQGYDYLYFEYTYTKTPTANNTLKYTVNPNTILASVLDFDKYYKLYSGGASGADLIGVLQLAKSTTNSIKGFKYGTASIKIGGSFAKALVTIKTGPYPYHFLMTLDFIMPILDYDYDDKFEGHRCRIKLSVADSSYSKINEEMIIYSNSSSSANLNWNEL